MRKKGRTLDQATLRTLAVEASVDPRSIAREIAKPGSVLGMAGERARAVLLKHAAKLATFNARSN